MTSIIFMHAVLCMSFHFTFGSLNFLTPSYRY